MPKMTRSPLGRTRSFQGKWMRTVSPRVGAKSRQCFGLKSTQTESPAFGAGRSRVVYLSDYTELLPPTEALEA